MHTFLFRCDKTPNNNLTNRVLVECPLCGQPHWVPPIDESCKSWSYRDSELADPTERWFVCLGCNRFFRTYWETAQTPHT